MTENNESIKEQTGYHITDVTESANLPTPFGVFNIIAFKDEQNKEHAAVYMGDISSDEPVLARIHSECLTGDTMFSLKCDCGFQLEAAMKQIAKEKRGVLLYVRQEGRGIGLFNKIKAYHLQDKGLDTVDANLHLGFPADARHYEICAEMFNYLKVKSIKLMTNNPLKVAEMKKYNINVVERVAIEVGRNKYNENYLDTKEDRMGHLLTHGNH
ncbi:GTP cyclohydrolase II [uncultured Ruminobacter sp.]|jgi:GTP cyclohydrolase II|uniref:GTP cyclohydrolase II n=1 Tax=Ruminobacter sp. TaxID=2774296 RepID=UPI0025F71D68|nr:GTP cyclohydrolase II [uncultured Ruminobacter sp.]